MPPPFPFVVGAPRSGTTLLKTMLDAHPQLAVPDESYFITDFARRYRRRGYAPDRYLADLARSGWFGRWGLPHAEVAAAFRVAPPDSFPGAVRLTYATYARSTGKPRYGDKTPSYATKVALLADLFPEAVFVHLVRDGRDVAPALQQASFGPSSLGGAALQWERYVTKARADGAALGDRYLEVRYEELVADPAGVLATVCAAVDLTFVPAMVDRTGATATGYPGPDHTSLALPITTDLRNWRTELTEADQVLIEALVGPTLVAAGYEPTPVQITAGDERAAAAVRTQVERERRRYRARQRVSRVVRRR